MITLTETAIKNIKLISIAETIGHQTIRVKVKGGGCAGFSYDMSFDEDCKETDECYVYDGVSIIVDPISHQYLDGVEIDYVEGLNESGFKFNNPNSKGSCGCGNSFSA